MKSMSIISILWNAPLSIKFVVCFLLTCSIMSWAIIIAKFIKLKKMNTASNEFENDFWSSKSLDSLFNSVKTNPYDPMSSMFCVAMIELKDIIERRTLDTKIVEKRMDRATSVIFRKIMGELESGMGFLSAIGTNGVIIGIFGTVLGIMGGFRAIAGSNSSSISIIAPVVSEALITTAIGLIVAIPAAIAYNILSARINSYAVRMENFQDELSVIMARYIHA